MAKQKLQLRQKQKHSISAGLRQSLGLLSLHTLDLRKKIEQALEENPFLESEYDEVARESEPSTTDEFSTSRGEMLEGLLSSETSLQEYLLSQLTDEQLEPQLIRMVHGVVSSLNSQGFAEIAHEETVRFHGGSRKDLRAVRDVLRRLEPAGIGAEDLWQSLEWQAAREYPEDVLLQDIISILRQSETVIDRLDRRRRTELANSLHLEVEQLDQRLLRLQQLDPHPAARFVDRLRELVYPDIVYEEKEGKIIAIVRDQLLPEISVNTNLYEEFRAARSDSDKSWDAKYQDARSLVRTLQYRHSTLEAVAQALLLRQPEFFRRGSAHVRPLNLQDIADMLDVHVSTISRIVSHKFCQCKWGIFSLKFFFPARLKSSDERNRGVEDLRQAILALVAQEEQSAPRSDEAMTQLLREQGFDIQRRTVAKYRKLLHIPSARDRKT